MAKSREEVQQLGIWDTQVSHPKHDAIVMWAYENADLIFRAACPERFDTTWQKDEVDLGWGENAKDRIALAREFGRANKRPNPRVVAKTIECVLKSHTGYQDRLEKIVGYADLVLETEFPFVGAQYKPAENPRGEDVFDGFAVRWTRKFDWTRPTVEAPRILVEAKSELPTLGELMRQINLYRTAFRGNFVVVSPDDKFAEILAEQNVAFIKYGA